MSLITTGHATLCYYDDTKWMLARRTDAYWFSTNDKSSATETHCCCKNTNIWLSSVDKVREDARGREGREEASNLKKMLKPVMCPFGLNSLLHTEDNIPNYQEVTRLIITSGGGGDYRVAWWPRPVTASWFQCLQSALPCTVTFKSPYQFARNTELWASQLDTLIHVTSQLAVQNGNSPYF